jgi:hypothetical protein
VFFAGGCALDADQQLLVEHVISQDIEVTVNPTDIRCLSSGSAWVPGLLAAAGGSPGVVKNKPEDVVDAHETARRRRRDAGRGSESCAELPARGPGARNSGVRPVSAVTTRADLDAHARLDDLHDPDAHSDGSPCGQTHVLQQMHEKDHGLRLLSGSASERCCFE